MLNTLHTPSPTLIETSYITHRRYVLGVLCTRCRWLEPCEREEILHDAYVVLLQKQRRGVVDLMAMSDEQVRAYVTQTALHKALDERKRASRRLALVLEGEDDQAELHSPERPVDEQALAAMQVAAMRGAVSGLPRRRQLVVGLRYFLERSPREIQDQLGVTERVYRRELERGTRAVAAALA